MEIFKDIQEEKICEETKDYWETKDSSESKFKTCSNMSDIYLDIEPNLNIPNKLANKQYIYMNNYKKSKILNKKFIIDNIFSNDSDIENKIYNLIQNPYQKKLNLINLFLDSDLALPTNNYLDIIVFFNWLNPLTIEYKMGSGSWNIKTVKYSNKEKILLQNSIGKVDTNENFYLQYIGKIKKILTNSKIKYYYFEFKSKRFNKIKDIIWVFDKN